MFTLVLHDCMITFTITSKFYFDNALINTIFNAGWENF